MKNYNNLFILLLIFKLLNGGLLEECSKISFPRSFGLRGYFGEYRQNLTGFPTEPDVQALIDVSLEKFFYPSVPEATITFFTDQIEPFTFVMITATNDGEEEFVLWGPLYSLTAVAAGRLNYSIKGLTPFKRWRVYASIKQNGDVTILPIFAHTQIAKLIFDDETPNKKLLNLVGLSTPRMGRAVGVEMIDCVAFRKEYFKKNSFDFFGFVDSLIKWFIAASMALTALVMASFNLKEFWLYLLIVMESLLGLGRQFQSRFEWMFLIWLSVYWFFQQTFSGEMISMMTAPARPKVIDSWQDLAANPQLKIVGITEGGESDENARILDKTQDTTQETSDNFFERSIAAIFLKQKKETYFGSTSPLYHDFTSRLRLVPLSLLDSGTSIELSDGDRIDLTTFNEDVVLMSICRSLRYWRFNAYCGRFKDGVHVSASGGEMMPYFNHHGTDAEEAEFEAINEVSLRLSEAGIFEKWLETNTFNLKKDSLKPLLIDYDDVEMTAFVGLRLAFVTITALGTLCLELATERVLIAVTAYLLLTRFGNIITKKLNSKPKPAFIIRKRRIAARHL